MSATAEQSRQDHSRQYAEFDEYIEFQLHRLRAGIRTNDVFTALCGVAVIVTAYLLAFVVLDHWVVDGGFSHSTRLISMLLLVAGTVTWVGLRVVRPCLRRVNRLYAAHVAESASTELDSNLLNYEDLRRSGRPVPKPILKALEKRAAVALSKADVDDAIDRRLLLRLSVSLLTVVLVFCLYTVLSPKKVWPSIWRAVNPVTATQVATETEIVDVQPGNKADVLARTLLNVTVDLRGAMPDAVELVYSTLDRSIVDERVKLQRADETLKRFACVLTGPQGDGLLQGMTYHIEAGDAVSPLFRIDVIQPPTASVEQIHYAYPDYMELRPERRESPAIDTWEGARLTFSASTNIPVQRAWIEFSNTESFPENPEPLPMDVEDGTRLSVEWQPIIREDGLTPKFYRVRCRTEGGASNPTPAVYPIEIRPDEKPQIEAVYPTGDLERPANAVVPLLLRARDPDFRMSRVTLHSRQGTIDLSERVLWRGNDREAEVEHDLQLRELGLSPGDVLTWWGEARDNRVIESPTRRLKDNNVSITPQLRIRIAEPVSETEVIKQQAFDDQQRQERLDELNQELRGDSETEPEDSSNDLKPDDNTDSERKTTTDDKSGTPDASSEPREAGTDDAQSQNAQSGDGKPESDNGKDGDQPGNKTSDGSKAATKSGDATGDGRSDDETSDPSSEAAQAGKSSTDNGPQDDRALEEGQAGKDGSDRRPVSNDGSDDDQVLRELLQKHQQEKVTDDGAGSSSADKRPGEENSPESDNAPAPQDASAGNQNNLPDRKSDGAAEQPTSGSSPETGKSPDQEAEGNADTNPDRKGNTPQSRGGDNASGQSKSTAEAAADPDSPASTGSDNDGTESTSRESGTPPKSGGKRGTQDSAGDSSAMPEGMPKEAAEGAAKSDQERAPSNADSTDNTTKPASGNGSKGTSQSAGADDQTSSGKSNSGSAGNAGSNQSASNSDGGKASAKSNGSSAGSSTDATSQSKGSSSPGSGNSKSDSEATRESENRTSNGQETNAGNPTGKEQPDGSSDAESSSGKGSPASKTGRDGDTEGPPDSKSTDRPDAAGSKTGSNAEREQSQPSDSSDQKSGDESAGKSGSESQSGKAGASSGGSGGSGNSQGANPSSGGRGMGSKGGKPGQAQASKGRPTNDDFPSDEPLPRDSKAGSSDAASAADPVDLEDRLKATNLVLKQLQDDLDRGKVNQELLDKLGWSEDDMRRFAERLQQRLSTDEEPVDPGEAAQARQFREMLKSLDLRASSRERRDAFNQKESTTDFSDLRERVPQKYRGAFEKYLDKLARQKRSSTP